MKIAFYIPILNVGGAEKVIVNLMKELSLDQINDYYLITDETNSIWIDEINNDKIRILNVNSKKDILSRLYGIKKAIIENRIDVVVSHLTHSNIHCLLLKLISNFKLLIVEHSITSKYIESIGYYSFKITKYLIKKLYNHSDFILCVSDTCKKDLIEKFKIKTEKIQVVYNPIDFNSIQLLSLEPLPSNIIKFLGQRKFFVSIGRLEAIKNHNFLIYSLKDYLIKNQIVLLIIGDGSEKNKLQQLIEESNLNENVLLCGYDLNPYKYISKCDMLIHPSKFEGFGLVLIEALFLKKKVISFNFEVAYEVLDNGNLGSIVNDKESLIAVLNLYLNKIEINQKNIEEISKKMYDTYNLQIITNEYKMIFNSIILD